MWSPQGDHAERSGVMAGVPKTSWTTEQYLARERRAELNLTE